jgi:hypothetical protein
MKMNEATCVEFCHLRAKMKYRLQSRTSPDPEKPLMRKFHELYCAPSSFNATGKDPQCDEEADFVLKLLATRFEPAKQSRIVNVRRADIISDGDASAAVTVDSHREASAAVAVDSHREASAAVAVDSHREASAAVAVDSHREASAAVAVDSHREASAAVAVDSHREASAAVAVDSHREASAAVAVDSHREAERLLAAVTPKKASQKPLTTSPTALTHYDAASYFIAEITVSPCSNEKTCAKKVKQLERNALFYALRGMQKQLTPEEFGKLTREQVSKDAHLYISGVCLCMMVDDGDVSSLATAFRGEVLNFAAELPLLSHLLIHDRCFVFVTPSADTKVRCL